MAHDNLIYEKNDNMGIVTINRPPANSWSLDAMEAFERILEAIENDPDIRVIIITGAGSKCFSAGMDVADAAKNPGLGAKGRIEPGADADLLMLDPASGELTDVMCGGRWLLRSA